MQLFSITKNYVKYVQRKRELNQQINNNQDDNYAPIMSIKQ